MDALGNVAVKLIGSQYHRFTYAPTGEEQEWDANFAKPTFDPNGNAFPRWARCSAAGGRRWAWRPSATGAGSTRGSRGPR